MKKLLSSIVLTGLLAASLSAFEWGGIFNNNTGFTGSDFAGLKIDQKDTLDLWAKIPLNRANTQYIAAEGYYKFEYDDTNPDKSISPVSNIVNVSVLKYVLSQELKNKSQLQLSAGRFGFNDQSGYILNQTNDGLQFSYGLTSLNFSVFAGYTGLQNSLSVTIITPDETNYQEQGISIYKLSPAYLPFAANVTLPSLFANQTLNVEALGCIDLLGDNFNRYYATLSLNGNITKIFGYSLKTTVGSINFSDVSNLSSVTLRFTPASFMAVYAEGIYASGENGFLKPFKGITSQKADFSMSEPEYSGLIKATLGCTGIIAKRINLGAQFGVVFDCLTETIGYKGLQYQISGGWNIFSDLQLGFTMSQFIANNADENKTALSVNLALAF